VDNIEKIHIVRNSLGSFDVYIFDKKGKDGIRFAK